MGIQCGGIGCTALTTDLSGLCIRCLRYESDAEKAAREKRQERFRLKFSVGNDASQDEAAEKSRTLAAQEYARGFLRSKTGYGSASPASHDHGNTREPPPKADGRVIFCRQCAGDGGATGNCPRCGGDGFEPKS